MGRLVLGAGRVGAAALLLVLSGCGYRLVGPGVAGTTGPSPQLQGLWLGPVEDDSKEPLVGAKLRAAIAREAVDQASEGLASRANAKALLTARVLSVLEPTVAFTAGDVPQEYLLKAEVEATLTLPDGRVLWKGLKIGADRQYAAGSSVEQTQQNKNAALERLSRDLSREILRRVVLSLDKDYK